MPFLDQDLVDCRKPCITEPNKSCMTWVVTTEASQRERERERESIDKPRKQRRHNRRSAKKFHYFSTLWTSGHISGDDDLMPSCHM